MATRRPKDVVLLELALALLQGGTLSHDVLRAEYGLERRTAARYLGALRDAGLPVVAVKGGGGVNDYVLHHSHARMDIAAIDVTPSSAKTVSLLLVAAALLPRNLGVRDAVDSTVRQALRLHGMRLSTELRRFEDAVVVLENEAKDYTGREDIFEALFDAALAGWCVEIDYTSPKRGIERRRIFPATLGLYRGGLYVLGVDEDDNGEQARWWALERLDEVPIVVGDRLLDPTVRRAAIAAAGRRWGPVQAAEETLVTLHFSPRAAPYVRARPWHTAVDAETWEDGGLRVSVRLHGATFLFESWLLSWGQEVQVLRPRAMAERLADEMSRAAEAHRAAAAAFARDLE